MDDVPGQVLTGSRFERVRLSGAYFPDVDLSGARFDGVAMHGVAMHGVVMRGAELVRAEIHGDIAGLTVNGVDVGRLVEAELDHRYPDRAAMRPTDPAGFRAASDVVERLSEDTVVRARRLDPALLHEPVDGEWSFTETLRRLAFATEWSSWSCAATAWPPSAAWSTG